MPPPKVMTAGETVRRACGRRAGCGSFLSLDGRR